MDSNHDLVCLNTFFDALDARRACEFLEEEGIPFTIKDCSVRRQGVNRFTEGPAILMEVDVAPKDQERAQECLRRRMHLFPEREVVPAAQPLDGEDDVLSEAFVCDTLADADAVSQVIKDSGIWSDIRQDIDADNEPVYVVGVNGQDIERAVDIVNRWLLSTEVR